MSRKPVNYRMPEDVLEGIAKESRKRGIDRTQLVETAIRKELGLKVKSNKGDK